jgi:tryptophan-rich sensory protein
METTTWYATLLKPSWAPPAWVFGPVWTVLYAIIAISFGYVFYKIYQGVIPMWVAVPFVLNLFFNFIFTPIQFSLQSNLLAAIDISLVLATLLWAMYAIYPLAPWVLYVNIPYLIWVCIATTLQFTITYLNW